MPEIIIDGRPIRVKTGETILQAANKLGVYIPTLCWDERLKPSGACRMCVVEVEGSHKLVAACCTPARDGMVVSTASERVHESRKLNVELMLASHPGEEECSYCVKCGSCVLQSWAYAYGLREPALPMHCRHCTTPYCMQVCPNMSIARVGDAVYLDADKCIGCRQCAMVCPFGVMHWDGKKMVIRKCDLCVHRTVDGREPACVEVCPSGALEYGEFDSIMARQKNQAAGKLHTAVLTGGAGKNKK
jgi:NADH dehydrogenase/NADH:ubiquinone oxidoreductase subunit G